MIGLEPKGTRVRILDGPFAGLVGEIVQEGVIIENLGPGTAQGVVVADEKAPDRTYFIVTASYDTLPSTETYRLWFCHDDDPQAPDAKWQIFNSVHVPLKIKDPAARWAAAATMFMKESNDLLTGRGEWEGYGLTEGNVAIIPAKMVPND